MQTDLIEKLKGILSPKDLSELKRLVENEKNIPPKIAIIGKSGVGKTTTINSLFNVDWNISHTVAGTKQAQSKEFELIGGGKLNVIDLPGLGEDIDTDKEYELIYRNILPEVDIVLYVIQANAKDFSEDQRIILEVVKKSLNNLDKKIIIGLNQVDKIGPGEWNTKLNLPSPEQQQSIERRCTDIVDKLSKVTSIKKEKIVYYSAFKRYNLYILLNAMIRNAGDLGWKMPLNPADPFELADPSVREYLKNRKSK